MITYTRTTNTKRLINYYSEVSLYFIAPVFITAEFANESFLSRMFYHWGYSHIVVIN